MDTTLVTARTRLRPVVDDDVTTLHAIRSSASVAAWWHPAEEGWPTAPEEGLTTWAVELVGAPDIGPDGSVIGFVQAYEGTDPDYEECGIDLFLAGSVQRRGLGREVVTAVLRWLVDDRGHHLVTIDPAAHNDAAIACYRSCGFEPVGRLVGRERDADRRGWHDSLLMQYAVPPRDGRVTRD